ncbi:unnamed protein product, partial [Polarella glacialis]
KVYGRPPASSSDAAAHGRGASGRGSSGSNPQALTDWLQSLDGGRGSMLAYEDVLRQHFDGDLRRIAEARVGEPKLDGGVVSTVDPVFFEVISCEKLGHKIMLAKGIKRLAGSV